MSTERKDSLKRFNLLYSTQKIYKEKKDSLKKEMEKERFKECTYQPKLYQRKQR
jgi:hypothetical protein